jgi:hypothetical protein
MIAKVLCSVPALMLAASGAAAAAKAPGCRGKLSGSVTAKFACSMTMGTGADGTIAFVISTPGPVPGIPALVPGSFQVPGPRPGRTYTLDELGLGRASVAAEGGALYTATKTTGQRGEVTLTLRSVKKHATIPGGYEVHGRYRARLVPAGGGRTGEVIVDVDF